MKAVGLITKGVLLLLAGTIAPAYAQREQQGKEQGKPQQEQQHQQAKPAQQQHQQPQKEQAKPAQQQHQQAKPAQQHQQTANKPAQRSQQAYESTTAACHNTKGRCVAVSRSLAPVHGITTIAPGSNAAAITATEFLKTASGSTSGVITSSASAAFRWFS